MVNDSRDAKKHVFTMRDRIAASTAVTTLVGLIAVFGAAVKWR